MAVAEPATAIGRPRRLLSLARLRKLAGFTSTQAFVQAVGFLAGVVIVRVMEQEQYGLYTLALTMVGLASVLLDLGLSTAVVSLGGPHHQDRSRLQAVLADARRLQRRLALLALLLLPVFVWMLSGTAADATQVASIAALVFACAGVQLANTMALAVVRLRGDLVLQQLLEVGTNLVKLSIVIGATAFMLDAPLALGINLFSATLMGVILWRHLIADIGPAIPASGEYTGRMWHFIRRHAPNAVYYCLSGQLAIWLVGLFGSAERVAEVGALGRLALLFALIGSIMTVIVQPFFARASTRDGLIQAFWTLNLFFALLTSSLVGLAVVAPELMLWILGPKYAGLRVELAWMVLATSLSAWGAAAYSVGAARGWIVPAIVVIPAGALTLLLCALTLDVSSVAGSFKMNASAAAVTALISLGFVLRQLRAAPIDSLQVTAAGAEPATSSTS